MEQVQERMQKAYPHEKEPTVSRQAHSSIPCPSSHLRMSHRSSRLTSHH